MKSLLPFLITCLFLCIGCTQTDHRKADILERKMIATPFLSVAFDSLLQEVRMLSATQRVRLLLNAGLRNENDNRSLFKREHFLLEAFPLSSRRERKQILLQLIEIYSQQLHYGSRQIKGVKQCEELEREYTLSKEERWRMLEIKAILLNETKQQELYMPIWFQLLEEHRQAEIPELIIKDLCTIGSCLDALGDQERALVSYKEAYELSTTNKLFEQRKLCLIRIIGLASRLGRNKDVLGYYHRVGMDSMLALMPVAYYELATCYMQLHKLDSARFYFQKDKQSSPFPSYGIASYCNIAQTFIREQREDSAAAYLAKAMECYQVNTAYNRRKMMPSSLPDIFLDVYPSFAILLQQNGKIEEAGKAFALIEPLIKRSEILPAGQKSQIDALSHYANYCRVTEQYAKGFELLLRCDSLRNIYDSNHKQRADANLVARFKMQELVSAMDMQKVRFGYSQQLLVSIGSAALILVGVLLFFIYLYRKRQRQFILLFNKDREIEQLITDSGPPSVPIEDLVVKNPASELFQLVEQLMVGKQFFLKKDLSLEMLAQELKTNRSYLSSCINSCSGYNFNQWMNNYRIDYVLAHIDSATNLLQLAEEAGFLSSDSFYRHFKRCTQLTPSQYLKKNAFTFQNK